ncbi:MAG TPA: sialate O-acetylesterase [bacterium]|nr:sialate O-acetylesterase [bacterium]HPP12785.1 sialate O-acetylesterase [bacterium]
MKKGIVWLAGIFLVALLSGNWCAGAGSKLELCSLLSDHAVLQQGMAIPVWGWAEPDAEVSLSFAGQTVKVKADPDGRWQARLAPLSASKTSLEMTVRSGQQSLVVRDILVGEVWLCSGQSNMALTVSSCLNPEQEKAGGNQPLIRHFRVPLLHSAWPEEKVTGSWQVCSPEVVAGFTATGYFFAREIVKELGVPVGIVNCSWGGTRIEPWICPQGYSRVPQLKDLNQRVQAADPSTEAGRKHYLAYLEELKNWIEKARVQVEAGQNLPKPPAVPWIDGDQQQPTRIYNAMVHPLVSWAIRGVLWYQGESNGSEGESYYHKMRALIEGWRTVWNQGDFSFYFVQLPNFQYSDPKNAAGGDGWTLLREAQLKCLEIPRTGMAVTIDIGEAKDIHPKNKQDVGKRLARLALAGDYGRSLVPTGPLYKRHVVEGNKIRIFFDNVGQGLMVGRKDGLAPVEEVPGGRLSWFSIAGEDRKFVPAEAVIDGATVVVSSPGVPKPVAVRYAFAMNPAGCNLYNREGFPASPFRTDNW